jgi:hypothetical protein
MDKLREYREQELRCRQRAAYEPSQSWRWLAEAEMWEHRQHEHIAAHFEECNTAGTTDRSGNKAA